MRGKNKENRVPEPATTRTDRDRVMVGLGLLIIIFFLVAAYLAITEGSPAPARKIRGPMKFPHHSELWDRGKDFVNDRRVGTRSECRCGTVRWSPAASGRPTENPADGLTWLFHAVT